MTDQLITVEHRWLFTTLTLALALGAAGCHHGGCTKQGDQPCIDGHQWVDCYAAEGGGDVLYECPTQAPICQSAGNQHSCVSATARAPAPELDASVAPDGAADH